MIGDGICQDQCNFDAYENDDLDCCQEFITKPDNCDCVCHIDGIAHESGPERGKNYNINQQNSLGIYNFIIFQILVLSNLKEMVSVMMNVTFLKMILTSEIVA